MIRFNRPAALLIALGVLAGCANMNNAGKGGLIGAGAGGVIGGVIGRASGNTAAGAIIGAAVGGTAGATIGHYMDKQAAELQRDLKDAKVERVGEGIKITFNSGILFDVDSDKLRSEANTNLSELAKVLKKYDDTEIMVQGHTDNSGADNHNLKLSERRADAVGDKLKGSGVKSGRIDESGLGEQAPVEDNGSASGRQANRRVEVAIWANNKLKKAAEDGNLSEVSIAD
ncbi:MAG: OmpA family protein [Fibrobacterota bacterium]|nr:OmpA family protein [Fibrobacterota bacterium]